MTVNARGMTTKAIERQGMAAGTPIEILLERARRAQAKVRNIKRYQKRFKRGAGR